MMIMALKYLAVGFATIPAGCLYALSVIEGIDNWLTISICFVIAFISASKVWNRIEDWERTRHA